MNLREFLKLYNFRETQDDREDTKIVRIYTEWPKKWFEFGINDWFSYDKERNELVELFINKEILDKEVTSISYDSTNEIFSIQLENKEDPK